MTTRGYTFGVCERCANDRRLEAVAGEWICERCAERSRPAPPIAGQLNLGGDTAAGTSSRSQIGPGEPWPEDFF